MSEQSNHGDCGKCREIETDLCPRCRVCLDCCACPCPSLDIERDELARLVAVGKRLAAVAVSALALACSAPSDRVTQGTAGGAVSGAADTHCLGDAGRIAVATHPAACDPGPGATGADATSAPAFGDTRFNHEADDDDCKYHVSWSSTPIRRAEDVSFELTASRTVDDQPAVGAAPWAEVYLDSTHPAPNTMQEGEEESPGLYRVGPIRFDAPGIWTMRYHLYSDCVDLSADSPHGHVAFYVEVP